MNQEEYKRNSRLIKLYYISTPCLCSFVKFYNIKIHYFSSSTLPPYMVVPFTHFSHFSLVNYTFS